MTHKAIVLLYGCVLSFVASADHPGPPDSASLSRDFSLGDLSPETLRFLGQCMASDVWPVLVAVSLVSGLSSWSAWHLLLFSSHLQWSSGPLLPARHPLGLSTKHPPEHGDRLDLECVVRDFGFWTA